MVQPEPEVRSPRTLIAVAVVEHEGRFLIGRRPPGTPLEGYWEFPGGKLQSGETAAQAAIRECAEETGLDVTICGEYPSALYDYPHGQLELRFFACRLSHTPQTPRAPYQWVAAHELAQYTFPPANASLVAHLTTQPGMTGAQP